MNTHHSITSVTVGKELYNHYRVRVFRKLEGFEIHSNQDLFDEARAMNPELYAKPSDECVELIATRFAAMDRVTSVEIMIGPTRQGIIFTP